MLIDNLFDFLECLALTQSPNVRPLPNLRMFQLTILIDVGEASF